ncbi:hypothetical protein BJX65DRAFT_315080 [Aspergillus insuetus]
MVRFFGIAALAFFATAVTADSPDICKPGNKVDGNNPYTWVQNECQPGHCKESCDTFIEFDSCKKDNRDQILDELVIATTLQLKKDGFTETTEYGSWFVAWDFGVTAVPNQDIVEEMLAGINVFRRDRDWIPPTFYFRFTTDDDRTYGLNAITHVC